MFCTPISQRRTPIGPGWSSQSRNPPGGCASVLHVLPTFSFSSASTCEMPVWGGGRIGLCKLLRGQEILTSYFILMREAGGSIKVSHVGLDVKTHP